MFGLTIVVYFCGLFIMKQWRTTFLFLGFIVTFFVLEFFLNKTIDGMINNPKFQIKYGVLLFFGFFMGIGAIFFIFNIWNWLPHEVYDHKSNDFGSTYLRSLIISLVIFQIFLSIKLFLVGSKVVKAFDIKRGYLGLLYRIVVILQNIIVSFFWIKYFEGNDKISFINGFMGKCRPSTEAYIAAKFLMLAYLLWDLTGVVKDIERAKLKFIVYGMVGDYCELCHKSTFDVVHLRCGHSFCEGCIIKSIFAHPFCPVCGEPPLDMPNYSFNDGYPSLASLFCCF